MRNGTYTAKRRVGNQEWRGNATRTFNNVGNFGSSLGYSRNRNTIKLSGSGRMSRFMVFGVGVALLLNLAMFYVGQSTKATSFDYELSNLSTQIDELEAKKEDLAVERARLTSIANSNNSKVAAAMEDVEDATYAE